MTAKPDSRKIDHAVSMYLSGQSALQVESLAGVGRGVLKAELIRRGIEPRNRSAAGKLRAAKMTREQLAAQTAAAHRANRGRTATWEERSKRASSVERKPPPMSVHEQVFADDLNALGIPFRREAAVGVYNLDFALGSVGVEILGGEWHAYKGESHPRRIKYILSQSWALVYVWATRNYPLTIAAAEYCVSYSQQVSRDPSILGEYRVIRGDAHLIASGRDELDEFTVERSARDGLKLTPSERASLAAAARWDRHR